MNILALHDYPSACSHYRLKVPLAEARHQQDYTKADLDWCDVLVVQRLFQPTAQQAVDYCNERGKLTVYDIDDDLWSIPEHNPASAYFDDEVIWRAAYLMCSCAVVTTTNDTLAARLRMMREARMKLLSAYDVFSGCAWYRAVLPAHAAMLAGNSVRVVQREAPKVLVDECDVLQMQRLFQRGALAAIRRAQRNNALTVYDVDDDLWSISRENPSRDYWELHKGKAANVLRECDIVTTTNDYLAEILRTMHGDVRVIPNALPMDWTVPRREHEGVVIGWAGSSSHEADLRLISDIILEVLDARPNVRMEMAGAGEWLTHERIRHMPLVPIENYSTLLARYDIGLAPLEDSRFNRCKSDLKVIEYAGLGIPSVASNVRPYAESIEHGVTGYLASNGKDWRRYLLRLIDEASTRKRMGDAAKAWADTRTIDKVLPRWEAVWNADRTHGEHRPRREGASLVAV